MRHVAVVGASLAGLSAVDALRREGYDGRITVVEAASELPPDRPPLSKKVLAGTMDPEAALQPQALRLDELACDLRLGVRATDLRPADRTLTLSEGPPLAVDGVVIATGAVPRRLPTELAGVHVLRTLEDCLGLRADLVAGPRRVAVVGAGFIGAEVAATCRGMGLEVTMIEAQDRPMQRVLPGAIGGFVADLHRDHGVEVRLGVGIEGFEGGDRVEGVRMVDGSVLEADVVVVGIGVAPATDWLAGSGLDISDGVACDETLLAAPGIVAAGDLARWPNDRYGEVMRVEQWEHAVDQGAHAGRRLLAGDAGQPYRPVPWFWSDQYDRKLQLAGRVGPDDEVRVVSGSVEERRFVALFRRGDRCTAALGVNRPALVVKARMAMEEHTDGWPWDDAVGQYAS